MKELLKIVSLLFIFGLLAPAVGFAVRDKPLWQKALFGAMCFMTIGGLLFPAEWGLTLKSIEFYRGHARGFHVYFNEAIALALLVAQALRKPTGFRWLPPGMWLYLVFCLLGLLTVFWAASPSLVLMAAFKAIKMLILCSVIYNFIQEEKDLQFFLRVMACTLCWEMGVVLFHKYVLMNYQNKGTFTHQNSLTMYTSLIGMLLLGTGLGPRFWGINLCLVGYVACGVIVESALSRAGLAVFGAGTVGVIGLSMLERITPRRITVLAGLTLVGLLGLSIAADTLYKRFTEKRNEVGSKTRTLLKESSWEMVKDHPLGVGWNNFALMMNQPYRYGNNFDRWTIQRGYRVNPDAPKAVVESLYWLVLAENGPISLLCLLCFFVRMWWWNCKAAFHYRSTFLGCVSIGLMGGFGTNYLQSYFERVLVFDKNMMLWLLLLGITAKIETWRRRDVQRRAAAPLPAPAAWPSLPAPQLETRES